MNPDLQKLQPYPFEKLAQLKQGLTPNTDLSHIPLSIGEPKHAPPAFVLECLAHELPKVSRYPATKGLLELRHSICQWLCQRFGLAPSTLSAEEHVLPVNGTREALFAFAQAVVDRSQSPTVLMPNPFYQIYEGAAWLSGAEPLYLNCDESNDYQPDFAAVSEQQWRQCQLLYLCSPNNPTGSVLDISTYQYLIELADQYNFIIASDECYSEIYPDDDAAPIGLLQACAALGRDNYRNCMVFHSLSKRSNLPGLRSGFVAGDANLMKTFLQYRTYHGCAMSLPVQLASIAAWQDEAHVADNRQHYREKFTGFANILEGVWDLSQPAAGFNFWARTPIDDQAFTKGLFTEQHVTVLPGSYLSRETNGVNPGKDYVRMALVSPLDECLAAAERIRQFIQTL